MQQQDDSVFFFNYFFFFQFQWKFYKDKKFMFRDADASMFRNWTVLATRGWFYMTTRPYWHACMKVLLQTFFQFIRFLPSDSYIPFLSWCELFTQLLHSVAWARKGSGLGKDVHDATDLSLSLVGYLSSTHFLWLLRCTALIVSLFRTPRDGFKVAVFICYLCRSHGTFEFPFQNFFLVQTISSFRVLYKSFLSLIKLFTQRYQRYEPCYCSG